MAGANVAGGFNHGRLYPGNPAVLLTVFLTLSACGGGGGSGSSPSGTDPDTGDNTPDEPGPPGTGQRVRVVHYDFDHNGTAEGRAELSYDSAGRIERIDYRYSDDGTPDTDFLSFSLDFGAENNTHEYAYDEEGYISSIVMTSPSSRIVNLYTWNDQGLITDYSIEFYAPAGGLQNIVRYELIYDNGQLTGWNETFEPTGMPQSDLAEGVIAYDPVTALPMMISRTGRPGGMREDTDLVFSDGGQVSSLTTTTPSIPAYESNISFVYSTQGRITERNVLPDDPAQTYSWLFTYNGSLMQQQLIDMGSNGSYEAALSYEWEEGLCAQIMIWAPRAEPNFIATGNEPFIPGTGYARLDYCESTGSTL